MDTREIRKTDSPSIINIEKVCDERGNLSFIESGSTIPFTIKRVYWIYDVPGGSNSDGHAFKTQMEFIIAISGSFDVILNDGERETKYFLNRSYYGLLVPAMTWRKIENFSTNALCLVVSSTIFDENDYIRNFDEFVSLKRGNHKFEDNIEINANCGFNNNDINTSIDDCNRINLPFIHRKQGNLTSINNQTDIPFDIERIYYLYDVPAGAERGGHAHTELHQYIISAAGSFDVILDDGRKKKTISLNRPQMALHIVPGIWREVVNFSGGAICLALASNHYDEAEYIRDKDEYYKIKESI